MKAGTRVERKAALSVELMARRWVDMKAEKKEDSLVGSKVL